MELYLRPTGFFLWNNFSIHFHERVIIMNGSKWDLLIYPFYFCPRTMGKYGLAHSWKCMFYQKKIAQAIVLNIWAAFHQIQTIKKKEHVFLQENSDLPARVYSERCRLIPFWCVKGKNVRGGELCRSVLDLTFRWVCFLVQRAQRKVHCGRCIGKCVRIFTLPLMSEMNIWMRLTMKQTFLVGNSISWLTQINRTQMIRRDAF